MMKHKDEMQQKSVPDDDLKLFLLHVKVIMLTKTHFAE